MRHLFGLRPAGCWTRSRLTRFARLSVIGGCGNVRHKATDDLTEVSTEDSLGAPGLHNRQTQPNCASLDNSVVVRHVNRALSQPHRRLEALCLTDIGMRPE
jgi:hypothetical protein